METASLLRPLAPGNYCDPARYHLTLAFLGDLPEGYLPSLRQAMENAATGQQPFSLSLGNLSSFGPVLWRGVMDSEALGQLAADLRRELNAAAIPYDPRPFRPHITLAYDTEGMPSTANSLRLPEADFLADTLILYESTRQSGQLAYMPRIRVAL